MLQGPVGVRGPGPAPLRAPLPVLAKSFRERLSSYALSGWAVVRRGCRMDELILVDEADRRLGRMSKALCHEGRGVLHRAFSLLIFNDRGELLMQQRAPTKRLWPLYWSNSCCSHPRDSESMDAATRRRLSEELGIHCDLQFLFKFQYHAQFDATGAEHELCSVYIGQCNEPLKINRDEIFDWRWISPDVLQGQMSRSDSSSFTPWFMMEWARIWRDHRAAVLALQSKAIQGGREA